MNFIPKVFVWDYFGFFVVLETKVTKSSPQKKGIMLCCFPSHKKTVFEIKFSFLVFQKAGCFWKQIDDFFWK